MTTSSTIDGRGMTRNVALISILVASTLWFAGHAVLALVVAPAAFSFAPPKGDQITREAAGALFGLALNRWSGMPITILQTIILLGLGLLAGTAWRLGQRRRGMGLVIVICLTWVVHVQTGRVIEDVSRRAAERQAQVRTDEADTAFAEQHQASERWFGLEMLIALAIASGAAVTLARDRGASAPAPGP
jgi:hypothetical protein